MFARICQILSIVSFVMISSAGGAAYFGYKYLTSDNFQSKMMNKILGNVQGMMPKILNNELPDVTGPTIPKFKVPKF